MALTIKESLSGEVLAHAESGPIRYEGNLYFEPADVNADRLTITARTYTCPYKGTCYWVDYVGADGRVARDVAWVYPSTKPGHEAIAGRYGFYSGARAHTRAEEA